MCIRDSSSYEQWSSEGSLSAEQRANAVWKRMLADYEDPGLDPAIDEALQQFMRERRAALSDSLDED